MWFIWFSVFYIMRYTRCFVYIFLLKICGYYLELFFFCKLYQHSPISITFLVFVMLTNRRSFYCFLPTFASKSPIIIWYHILGFGYTISLFPQGSFFLNVFFTNMEQSMFIRLIFQYLSFILTINILSEIDF